MLLKYSVLFLLLFINLVRSDVSHLTAGTHHPVDEGTIEILKKNITDYLVHLGSDGSPQMQLKQIYHASKQIVTGTVYTVQALLETSEGAKQCEIHILEQAWFDFCQVRVKCENGAQYEVTINNQNLQPFTQHLSHQQPENINYPYPPPVTNVPNPFLNLFTTKSPPKQEFTQAPVFDPPRFNYESKPQPQLPKLPKFPKQPQAPVHPQHPEQPHFPSLPQIPVQPQFPVQHQIPEPQPAPQPQVVPQPSPAGPKPERPAYNVPEQPQQKPHGVPIPVFPPAPEINVLPYDQLPKGEALQTYMRGLFDEFMVKYDREYIDVPGEREYRYSVFSDNFYAMYDHAVTDTVACQYSVTEFSDLTQEEFSRILGFDVDGAKDANFTLADTSNSTLSGEVKEKCDLRDEKLVTRVKLQGDCGACWAFTTIAVIEGLCAKRTKKLQEFSEQSLLDCDNGNYGCKGGFSPNAIKHLVKRGGLELESSYPYVFAKDKCKFQPKNVRVKVAGTINFKKNDEEGMKRWLCKNGPILVGINSAPLKYYKGGVLNPTPALCNAKKIDHGVTLVGYGVEVNTSNGEKLPYWIAKNSWGPRWGEKGFFRIVRGKNACGLALWAYSAQLANVPNNCLLPDGK